MRLEVAGTTYYIDFIHNNEPWYVQLSDDQIQLIEHTQGILVDSGHWKINNGSTQCVIMDDEWQEIGYGEAECSRNDLFDKRKGRKVSLTRALQSDSFSREQRKSVWEAYFMAMPKDRT